MYRILDFIGDAIARACFNGCIKVQRQSREAIAKCGETFGKYNTQHVYVRGTNLQVGLPPACLERYGGEFSVYGSFMSNFLETSDTNSAFSSACQTLSRIFTRADSRLSSLLKMSLLRVLFVFRMSVLGFLTNCIALSRSVSFTMCCHVRKSMDNNFQFVGQTYRVHVNAVMRET